MIVEIPKNSGNKYEYDGALGVFRPAPVSKVRIEFLTPTELKSKDQIADVPEFPILFGRIRDRLSTRKRFGWRSATSIQCQPRGAVDARGRRTPSAALSDRPNTKASWLSFFLIWKRLAGRASAARRCGEKGKSESPQMNADETDVLVQETLSIVDWRPSSVVDMATLRSCGWLPAFRPSGR
jgi:hypothetical protein